ncbi:hypothetical protein COE80_19450 [Bacillus pseudomycoides]|uniref:hypothetical protein n=1 Tax=Bacillus pseudomycoides TaxID=64104 RepID=UPI000BFE8316|nr:hypothetical protein [Bacillus pseudomycoides]PHB23090.1 hypothetical protein COE80_19450 [Bacillus pseudomycoides]PHE37619.1 hypothetical protein COF51_16415 [Bacillus pseudomycoides]
MKNFETMTEELNLLQKMELDTFKGNTVMKAVQDVMKVAWSNGDIFTTTRNFVSDLESYLLFEGATLASKFDPTKSPKGWEGLGANLYFLLQKKVKTFKSTAYKYLDTEWVSKEDDSVGFLDSETHLDEYPTELADEENDFNTKTSKLFSKLTDLQKNLLKLKLDGVSNKEAAEILGKHRTQIVREMKYIQREALSVGFMI